ncbi:hypothetical protein MSG28_013594 [Choristoneura fumiferana]|uniref:Uncharacterized protein n=1 Tax=Choristoneura fumiferana TaxID=7141 RepID=A0ACC0K8R0_CHOFU|nr:hypothetical protein MSG28_013594 [Choristoneura fumiferana]
MDETMESSEQAQGFDYTNHDNTFPLSPIIAEVYPNNAKDPDYLMIPSISSLPSVGPSTPETAFVPKPRRLNRQLSSSKQSEHTDTENLNSPNQMNARRKIPAKKSLPSSNSSPSVRSGSSRPILQAKRKTRSKSQKPVTAKKVKEDPSI